MVLNNLHMIPTLAHLFRWRGKNRSEAAISFAFGSVGSSSLERIRNALLYAVFYLEARKLRHRQIFTLVDKIPN